MEENIWTSYDRINNEAHVQDLKMKMRMIHHKMMEGIIPILHKQGKISEREYLKYLLDETGDYFPKLENS